MKNWKRYAKLTLKYSLYALLAWSALMNFASTERGRKERCGRVRNMDFPRIPNNGGL